MRPLSTHTRLWDKSTADILRERLKDEKWTLATGLNARSRLLA
jgi:hypothetical protein